MRKWWIGCSGFYYKEWREKFYPKGLPQRKWFEFYCESFNTVELNVTFYRFPKLEALKGWYQRSPEDFTFTVKAPRLVTHYRRFKNAATNIQQFYERVYEGLQEKLGCVLFQLHPAMEYEEETLALIISSLDASFTNAVEFRHNSWWNDAVFKTLRHHRITFCSISYPELPDDIIKTTDTLYYRFHGVPQLYLSSYSDSELQTIHDKIKTFKGVENIFCYFNNDIEVAAVYNAKRLQQIRLKA